MEDNPCGLKSAVSGQTTYLQPGLSDIHQTPKASIHSLTKVLVFLTRGHICVSNIIMNMVSNGVGFILTLMGK